MSHTKNYLAKLIKVFKVCLVKGIPHDLNVHVIQILQRKQRCIFVEKKYFLNSGRKFKYVYSQNINLTFLL